MSDSCRPRKLEAGLDGRYSISRVLMTSTMKSDPSDPCARGSSFGIVDSAAATAAEGGSTDGRGADAPTDDVAAAVPFGGVTALAAPATATPARNLRRFTLGCVSSRAIVGSLLMPGANAVNGAARPH